MINFQLSPHVRKRGQQRGRSPSDIAFVLDFGTPVKGGTILSSNDANEIERAAKQKIELAHKLKGTYVPHVENTVKTVFKASPLQQSKLL